MATLSTTTFSDNASLVTGAVCLSPVIKLAFGLVLSSALNFFVVGGNLLTLLCLLIDRHLRRNRTNYFVGSLAFADLTLGIFILPIFITSQWAGQWPFGTLACRIWLAMNVWLYTASIYSLIAVAVDRYWAITRPLKHKSLTTHARAISMIVWAWSLSFAISLPSLFFEAPLSQQQCTLMLHSSIFIIYSCVGSFYLPMIVLSFLYVNIYRTVRKVKLSGTSGIVRTMDVSASSILRSVSEHPDSNRPVRKRHSAETTASVSTATSDSYKRQISSGRLRIHKGRYHKPVSNNSSFSPHRSPVILIDQSSNGHESEGSLLIQKRMHPSGHIRFYEAVGHFLAKKHVAARNCRNKLLLEFRAVRVIAMITMCFSLCWAGFCVLCTMNAFARQLDVSDPANATARDRTMAPDWLIDSVTWLGYVNSAVNPLIYALSNRRFRRTFKRVLRFEFVCYW